ncbi:carbon-nitrogen hydrolase family protein [Vibrio maerlii]|uniref:carbon-nitrogen hydrolase family protein n=1 Tax=Vibrio maerlii TaxID=2231648 RepID=UPI000E3EBEE0|nr:carbon-nitrogen hydrolase family protein [Vibrio maerlii]
MSTKLMIGIVQMTSGSDPESNVEYIERCVRQLALAGAKLIVTPENAIVFGSRADYHHYAEPLGAGLIQNHLAVLAEELNIDLLIGSMPVRNHERVMTTSLLFTPRGLADHYDKLHMFDVDVADGHQRYRESETFEAGSNVVVAKRDGFNLGLSICYDLRFPHLFNQLARQGADIITVPAAFTEVTGEAHWEVLLRARAIENQCFIVAVGQGGTHPCGRRTWGHSMVIDPWGRVIQQLDQKPDTLLVEIDLGQIEPLKRDMPIQSHARFENKFKENN